MNNQHPDLRPAIISAAASVVCTIISAWMMHDSARRKNAHDLEIERLKAEIERQKLDQQTWLIMNGPKPPTQGNSNA